MSVIKFQEASDELKATFTLVLQCLQTLAANADSAAEEAFFKGVLATLLAHEHMMAAVCHAAREQAFEVE